MICFYIGLSRTGQSLRRERARSPLSPTLGNIGGIQWLALRSEEHTSELQSLMRISYAVFCLKKKNDNKENLNTKTRPAHTQLTNVQSGCNAMCNKTISS